MTISKKEGPPVPRGRAPSGRPQLRHAAAQLRQRPPQAAVARLRFRNIPAGVYENAATGKVIVIISNSEYYLGHIRIRQNRYRYASWRQGKKIKEKYLGALSTRP